MQQDEALIGEMLKPAFYPHEVTVPIHLVQTHISYVFLTGPYAYKVKKPVNMGFLDFSTLEKRHHFCQRELELNRRFSPNLYLDVLPIYQSDAAYSFSPATDSATPVEFAVRMKQFREDDVFLEVFKRGEVSEQDMHDIGRDLAMLHKKANTNADIAAYGAPDAIWAMFEGNFEHVQDFVGATLTQDEFESLRTFTKEFIERHRSRFEHRVRERKIRECHGDLHLNNICRYQGHIQFFDRIEFNELFKNIDVIYDLSFLLMDLEFKGRADLANVLLNTYLEHTGDYEGTVLLPVYSCNRAIIRGEVRSMLAEDPHADETLRAGAAEEATAYFHHAAQYAVPTSGQILMMSGLSGSGKSTVARQLAKELNAIHIRSDAVRKQLSATGLKEHGAAIYTPEMTEKTYARLTTLGVELASEGFTVILDAKYDRVALRSAVVDAAAKQELPLQILSCEAPLDQLKQRLTERSGDISDAGPDLLDGQASEAESFSEKEIPFVVHIDTQAKIDIKTLASSLSSTN